MRSSRVRCATTGRPRRCGWFDGVVARYSTRVNGLTDLAITKLDVLDTIDPIPVCSHYLLDGQRIDDMPDTVAELSRVQPVYERLPGWLAPTGEARRLADLPQAARRYLDRLEGLAETRVRYVGVGTRRAQLIEVT